MIYVIQQSCLEKIKADAKTFKPEYNRASVLSNEDFAYQVVLYSDSQVGEAVSVELRGNGLHTIYKVEQVPVNWPHYGDDSDEQYLSDVPTLLPDALVLLGRKPVLNITKHLTVLWIEVRISMPGDHRIELYLNGKQCARFDLQVLPHTLEANSFNNCQYIDPCSISKYYNFPMFSSEHWRMLGEFFKIAAEHGVTSVLTPLYTPHYGTLPMGGEPIQLFTLTRINNEYQFDFDLLDSWICIARQNGIKSFTFPPLIPSIETLKCPVIKIKDEYFERDLFDDKDDVRSAKYTVFIRRLLRELIDHLKEIKVFETATIQFTHEPSVKHSANYKECRTIFSRLAWGNQIADTMVSPEFYELRLGCLPFYSSAKIPAFLQYETGRYLFMDIFDSNSVISNLIVSPSTDIRKFGILAYRHRIAALFSLWFNNYCTLQGMKANVNIDTSNENSLPSGNGFLVYPGPKGPIPTIRLKQFYFALQDKRVLEKLSTLIPSERIESKIDKKYKIGINTGTISAEKFLKIHEDIYSLFDR